MARRSTRCCSSSWPHNGASADCSLGPGSSLSPCSPRARCCSSRRRPDSSTVRACWPRWRWTAGCRGASASLSARLVTQDGVLAMGLAAAVILCSGPTPRSSLLVVLYAINVFVTFTLSQLGMSVHLVERARHEPNWIRKLLVNGIGCLFTALILMLTVTLKFDEGGWVTIVITGGVDRGVLSGAPALSSASTVRSNSSKPKCCRRCSRAAKEAAPTRSRRADRGAAGQRFQRPRTGDADSIAPAVSQPVPQRHLRRRGRGRSALLKGPEEVQQLEQQMADDLREYCRLAADLGLHAELRVGIGPDVVLELRRLCLEVAHEFPHAVFFAGQLVFGETSRLHQPLPAQSHRARIAEVAADARPEPGDSAGSRGADTAGSRSAGWGPGSDSGLGESQFRRGDHLQHFIALKRMQWRRA